MSKKSVKNVRRSYSDEYRRNAVSLIENQSYTTAKAARELGVNAHLLRKWRQKYGKLASADSKVSQSEQQELDQLRKENHRLRVERDLLKKNTARRNGGLIAPMGPSRTKGTEISIHRRAPRRMADDLNVRCVGSPSEWILCLVKSSGQCSFRTAGVSCFGDQANSFRGPQGCLWKSSHASGTGRSGLRDLRNDSCENDAGRRCFVVDSSSFSRDDNGLKS